MVDPVPVVTNWGNVFQADLSDLEQSIETNLGSQGLKLVLRHGLDAFEPRKWSIKRPYVTLYAEDGDEHFLVGPPSDAGFVLHVEPSSFQAGDASVEELQRRKEANSTHWQKPVELLHHAFFCRAAERPEATAVIGTHGFEMTYGQLKNLAVGYASDLKALGLSPCCMPPARIGVVMVKGWEQVVAVFAILAAGGAYVPIEATFPHERLRTIVSLCAPMALLTQPCQQTKLEECKLSVPIVFVSVSHQPVLNAALQIDPLGGDPQRLAYIIFTSGSTGAPKGVMISHAAAANTCADMNDTFGINASDASLALSNLNFDLAVYDVFGILGAGGRLVMPHPSELKNPVHWAYLVQKHKVTVWNSVPQLASLLVGGFPARAQRHQFKLVFVSGDWVPLDLPDRLRDVCDVGKLVAGGGATEASIWSNFYQIDSVDSGWLSIPYGKPMRNQQMYVLSDKLQHQQDGVDGEIFIGGMGLAQGYWRDIAKTSSCFFIQPDNGMRLYRTGDLGTYLPSGDIRFIGRVDFQVKVRGNRVELGEVESVMLKVAGVMHAVCDVRRGNLFGYYVASSEVDTLGVEQTMKAQIKAELPYYMLPSAFARIESLPLSDNGKVNKRLLPDAIQDSTDFGLQELDFEPLSEIERVIMECVAPHMPSKQWTKRSDLFDSGMDSRAVGHLVSTIGKPLARVGVRTRVTVRMIYESSSVQALARCLEESSIGGCSRQSSLHSFEKYVAEANDWEKTSVDLELPLLRPPEVAPAFPWLCFIVQTVFLLLQPLGNALKLLLLVTFVLPLVFDGEFLRLSMDLCALELIWDATHFVVLFFAKWLILGRYREGHHHIYSLSYLKHWIVTLLAQGTIVSGDAAQTTFWKGCDLLHIYLLRTCCLKLLGADVAWSSTVGTGVSGFDLVSVGAFSTVNGPFRLTAVNFNKEGMHVARQEIGRCACLGPMSVAVAGTPILDGAIVEPHASWQSKPSNMASVDEAPKFVAVLLLQLLVVGPLDLVMRCRTNLFAFGLFACFVSPLSEISSAGLVALVCIVGLAAFTLAELSRYVGVIVLCRILPRAVPPFDAPLWSFRGWAIALKLYLVGQASLSLGDASAQPAFLRCCGARVGNNVVTTETTAVPEALEIGDRCFFASGNVLTSANVHMGRIRVLTKTIIGRGCFLGNQNVVGEGLPDDTLLGLRTYLPRRPNAPNQCFFGMPAMKFKRPPNGDAAHDTRLSYMARMRLHIRSSVIDLLLWQWLKAMVEIVVPLAACTALRYDELVLGFAYAAQVIAWLIFGILVRRLLYNHRVPRENIYGSSVMLNWFSYGRLKALFPPVFNTSGTWWHAATLRLLGSTVGRNFFSADLEPFLDEPWASVGDDVTMDFDARLRQHSFEDRRLKWGPNSIGDNTCLQQAACLAMSDTDENVCMGPLSTTWKGQVLTAHTAYSGSPASPCC